MIKKRLGEADKERIDEYIKKGKTTAYIAKKLGTSPYQINKHKSDRRNEKLEELEQDLLSKIRKYLKNSDNFGKFNEEAQDFIVELYRKNIPSHIIADLMGLDYNPRDQNCENNGFSEKTEVTFRDECQSAQAEPKVKLIMAAQTAPKPNDALRFLVSDKSTRDMYKESKEKSKGTVKFVFPGFSREPEPEEDEEEEPKTLN